MYIYLSGVSFLSGGQSDSDLPEVAIVGVHHSVPRYGGWVYVQARKSGHRKFIVKERESKL